MTLEREDHTATLLPSGKVLVVGGRVFSVDGAAGSVVTTATTDIYDPASQTWTPGPELASPREQHTATTFANGVLVVGGVNDLRSDGGRQAVSSAEFYTPDASVGSWAPAGELHQARGAHSATVVGSDVLVVGGNVMNETDVAPPELYRGNQTWTQVTAPLAVQRQLHSATALPDGSVLIAAGELGRSGTPNESVMRYFPGSTGGQFATVERQLLHARAFHTATLLTNGKVLFTGGTSEYGGLSPSIRATEVFDSTVPQSVDAGEIQGRSGASATLLERDCDTLCGKVVVVGGAKEGIPSYGGEPSARVDVFTPAPELREVKGLAGHELIFIGTGLASVRKVGIDNGKIPLCGWPGSPACGPDAVSPDTTIRVQVPDHAPDPLTGDVTVETEGGTVSIPLPVSAEPDGGPGPTVPQRGDSGNTNVSGTSVRGESSPPPASPTGTGGGSPGTLNSPGSVNAPASDGGTLAAGGSNTSSGGAISNAPGAAGSAGPPSPLVVSQSASAAGTTHAPAAATQVAGAGQAVGNAAVGPLAEEGSEAATRYTMDRSEPSGIPAVAFAGAALFVLFTCALLVAGDPAKATAAGAGGRGAY